MNFYRLNALYRSYFIYIHLGIISLLGIAAYANSLTVPAQFDDVQVVGTSNYLNIDLYSLQGFLRNPRWFADLTFALNRNLGGALVPGYHIINLVIHLTAAVVVYLLINRAIAALRLSFQLAGKDQSTAYVHSFVPFITAVLFVCHPIQTQAITYIVQRYASLTTLLYLNSLLAYLLMRLQLESGTKSHVLLWGVASGLSALLALKSKEIAFTLPIMATVLEGALFRGRLLKNRWFLLACTALLLIIPLQMLYSLDSSHPEQLLNQVQLATTEAQNIARTDYLLTQFRVVATYLRLLVVPLNQNLDYDYPISHALFNPAVVAAMLLHLALAGVALGLLYRSHRDLTSGAPATGMSMRLAGLGICWFYLALAIESSIIPIRDVIFEHRLYLPSVGFFLAAAAGAAGFAANRRILRKSLPVVLAIICIVLMAATIARNRIWSNEMAMWQDVVQKSPNKSKVRFFAGFYYFKNSLPDRALPNLVRALELKPATPYWITLNAQISILNGYKGRCSDGAQYVLADNTIDRRNLRLWQANSYNNLGLAYEYLGNMYRAKENYQKAINWNPALDFAWYNLALVAARQNDTSTLASSLKWLITNNPLLAQQAVTTFREQR